MSPERDKTKVRLAGALTLGIGIVMMLLTLFTTLFALFSGPTANYPRAVIAFGLLLILASTLMSCGMQLTRLRLYTTADIQTLRLNWTALVLVMVIGGLVSFWVFPQISDVCVVELVVLFSIRGAIIRLSA